MITLLYIAIGTLVLTNLLTIMRSKTKSVNAYWKGRYAGHKVTEDLAMRRAKENGYDVKKFWADILQ